MQAQIVLVTAGMGEPSTTALLGERLAEASVRQLEKQGISADITPIALRPLAKDITNHYLTGFPTGQLPAALDAVREATAIIAVTPIFKASYSGLFKSFWDLVEDGTLAGKPVLIAATGGTARHSLTLESAMRPLFTHLKGIVAPSAVFAATDDFGADTALDQRIRYATGEFTQLISWSLGAPPVAAAEQRGEDAPEGSTVHSEAPLNPANAGSFFGIAIETQNAHQTYKAPGLEALTVTPFEELLKRGNTQ